MASANVREHSQVDRSIVHLPIAHCPLPTAGQAECAERLNPPPLPYGKRWRVKSKAQVLADVSDPSQISPQHPCAFRRADPKSAPGWIL